MDAKSSHNSVSNEAELVEVYRPIIQAFAMTLGIYYLVLIPAHLSLLKGEVAFIMAALAAITAAIFLTVRFTYLQAVSRLFGLECTIFCLGALAIINVTAHSYLAHDPLQFVYLLMLAFGMSMIGPTQRIVGALLLFIGVIATLHTIHGPSANYINNVFTTVTAIAGGFASGSFLHRSIRAQVAGRTLTENLLRAVEIEGHRNKGLAEAAELANFAKADFLANMSHELRTPLNGVVGIAHALSATDLSAQQREMVDLIENSGQMLTRLLSDILDFSKIEAGKVDIERAPFNLREEFNAAACLLRGCALEKGLSFDVTYSHTAEGWFEGDVTRMKQIIANLTSNAVKFTEVGGIVLNIDWSDGSEILEIKVVDTGIGFDEAAGKRLFQRFVQADSSITRRFGGTGLGLSICRGLVDAMGGGMDWSSQSGQGSSFIVRLPAPRYIKPIAAEMSAVSPQQVGAENTLRILVADDNPTNRKLVAMILEPMGVDLVMCENGAIALEYFKTQLFDVVLMDMQMPILDGVAATRAIRAFEAMQSEAHTPIIMLTANATRQHRDEAKAVGADLHVTKPFTATALLAAIQTALQFKDQVPLQQDIQVA